MNHVEAVKIYITIGVALVGLISIYITHRLTSRRDSLSRFHIAATKFRDAFAPELAAAEADTENRIDYMEFLSTAYNARHSQAFIIFEPFVAAKKRGILHNDWNFYRYGENVDDSIQGYDRVHMDHASVSFLEYSTEWDLSCPERPRENAIKRIRRLMSYATES